MNPLSQGSTWRAPQPAGPQPDLARKAVAIGGVLMAAVVIFAVLTAVFGAGSPQTPAPVATNSAMARGDNLDPAKPGSGGSGFSGSSDSGVSEDSGSGDSEKSDKESGSGTKSSKKDSSSASENSSEASGSGGLGGLKNSTNSGGSGGGASGRVLPPNFEMPPRRTPAREQSSQPDRAESSGSLPSGRSSTTSRSASPGSVDAARPSPTRSALTCTIVVADQASLSRVMSASGPDDVICMRGVGTGGSPSPSALPRSSTAGRGEPPQSSGDAAPSAHLDRVPARSGASATPPAATSRAKPDAKSSVSMGAKSPDQRGCTKEVTDGAGIQQALSVAQAGDKICITIDVVGLRLEITKNEGAGSSVQIVGNSGSGTARSVTVNRDDMVVDGFTADRSGGPGI